MIVNRVWQYHFGRGLVGTASDFGRLGEAPTHPELLDWLATEFVAQGWQLKPLHRLILTSAAYRQAAQRSQREIAAAGRVDPDNRLLWKRTVQRLDAEEIRDAMLAASGELEPAMGGPSGPTTKPRRTIDTRVIRNTRDRTPGRLRCARRHFPHGPPQHDHHGHSGPAPDQRRLDLGPSPDPRRPDRATRAGVDR